MTTTTTTTTSTTPTATSKHIYVVTALIAGEDPVSPTVIGIYATREQAAKNAHAIFNEQKGEPVLEHGEELKGQEDFTTDFLCSDEKEAKDKCWGMRVLLEAYDGDPCLEAVVVAINEVPLDVSVEQDIPLLKQCWRDRNKEAPKQAELSTSKPSAKTEGATRVHVLVAGHGAVDRSGDMDPTLVGVFSTKDDAIAAAKVHFKHCYRNSYGGERAEMDLEHIGGKRSGLLMCTEDEDFGIAVATFVLDQDYDPESMTEMDLPIGGSSGLYMHPEIFFEEIRKVCSMCKTERTKYDYRDSEWKEADNVRACNQCFPKKTKPCSVCKTDKKYASYKYRKDEWEKSSEDRTCQECFPELKKECSICKVEKKSGCYHSFDWWKKGQCKECLTKVCSACHNKKTPESFSKKERMKSDAERKCQACLKSGAMLKMTSPVVGEKRNASVAVTVEKNAKKKARISLQRNMLECTACKLEKPRESFSKRQRKLKQAASARCKDCMV